MSVVEKRRGEVHCLPPGWRREEIIRKTGLSAGKVDIYYYRQATCPFVVNSFENAFMLSFVPSFVHSSVKHSLSFGNPKEIGYGRPTCEQ